METMYSYRIWIPSNYTEIIDGAIGAFTLWHKGCTVTNAEGYWFGTQVVKEPVTVIEVISALDEIPYIDKLKQQLIEAGEEAVLSTKQPTLVELTTGVN